MSESPKRSRVLITEEEHKLLQRYREQARAFNEGIAACMTFLSDGILAEYAQGDDKAKVILNELAKLRKDTP